jgi:regulator of replication initiation timing
MAQVDQETDSLAGLEDRIMKAVQLVSRLRQEKEAALAENQRLTEELDALRSERKQVRGRIEKLLGTIDTLGH